VTILIVTNFLDQTFEISYGQNSRTGCEKKNTTRSRGRKRHDDYSKLLVESQIISTTKKTHGTTTNTIHFETAATTLQLLRPPSGAVMIDDQNSACFRNTISIVIHVHAKIKPLKI
jgi:hypothetical protein